MNGTGGDAPRVLIHFIAATPGPAPGRIGTGRALVVHGHQHHLRLGHLDALAVAGARGCRTEPHRSASTDTRTVTDVRPTRTVSV